VPGGAVPGHVGGCAAAIPLSIHAGFALEAGSNGGFRLMANSNDEAHWAATTRLMWIHIGLWVFFGYIIHMFVVPLNKIIIPVLNFPLGFYMAAQGSLIAFVVMLFVFAKQQDKIDRDHGVAEDD
jgi:putative solute:sodium symporter small subunit